MGRIPKKSMSESQIQQQMVKWFGYKYPEYTLFAIPNGHKRNAITGAILKREGVVAGVADLFLMKANNKYNGLWIEVKTDKGKQSESQKEFERKALREGYKYVICKNIDQFIEEVETYINDND
jgi:hypothetical protein